MLQEFKEEGTHPLQAEPKDCCGSQTLGQWCIYALTLVSAQLSTGPGAGPGAEGRQVTKACAPRGSILGHFQLL